MSYVTMADFLAADGTLSGRKGRSFEPEAAAETAPAAVKQQSYSAQPMQSEQVQAQTQEQALQVTLPVERPASRKSHWSASAFFPSSPGGAEPAAPAQEHAQWQHAQQPDAAQQYAAQAYAAQQPYAQAETPDMGGALGAVIEYIRPAMNLREGSFASTAASEAGGDNMADDENMGAEQMLYEGLTGGETDKVASPGLSDSVDAGGQGAFVDVATMNSGNWEADDGTGVDVLVEPGQTQQVSAPVGRVDRGSSYRTNDAYSQPQQEAAPMSGPPVFRPARNGASSNGNGAHASSNGNGAHAARNGNGSNGNGVSPRNRITAFDSAAPYIQGTGAATAARPRGFDHVNPPNPAAFGHGMGQAPAPALSPGFELTNRFVQTAGQVGTAAIVSRTPPQFRAGLPGAPGTDLSLLNQNQQQSSQQSSVMPWVLTALGVASIVGGIWWFTRPKEQVQQADAAPEPQSQPAVVANRGRAKAKKTKKNGSKKSKRR